MLLNQKLLCEHLFVVTPIDNLERRVAAARGSPNGTHELEGQSVFFHCDGKTCAKTI